MIINKTPFRISFFGGGTDFPEFFNKHSSTVISSTINKFCYTSLKKQLIVDKSKFKFSYSMIDNVDNIEDIEHPVIRACLKYFDVNDPLEIHYDADLPGRSGIGSSSSFTVGLLHTLNKFYKRKVSKKQLAETAIHIEREILKENVGSQDQIICTYGGFANTVFFKNGNFKIKQIKITSKNLLKLERNLFLVNTNQKRFASKIAKTQILHMEEKKYFYAQLNYITDQAKKLLSLKKLDIKKFSELLNKSWEVKKNLSPNITNSKIDRLINLLKINGAMGAKLLGAGGGGFILALVPPKFQAKFKKKNE